MREREKYRSVVVLVSVTVVGMIFLHMANILPIHLTKWTEKHRTTTGGRERTQ
jgi:hypothetical protein